MNKRTVTLLSLLFSIFPISAQEAYFENPNPTHYMIGASAFQLNGGEFLYQNTELVFNSLSYGFTDNVSLGLGTELLTPIFGNGYSHTPSLVYLAPKVGFALLDKLNVSVGCELVYFPQPIFQDDSNRGLSSLMLGYGLLTLGTIDSNLTFGVNTLSSGQSFSFNNVCYNLSGITRLGRNYALVAEGYLLAPKEYLINAGWRVFGRHTSFDLGLATGMGLPFPLPVVGFSWRP